MFSLFVSQGSRITCSHVEGLFLLKLMFAVQSCPRSCCLPCRGSMWPPGHSSHFTGPLDWRRQSGSSQEGGAGHRSVVGALRFSCAWLHQFPVASVTNDHKQRLKQYTLNILQFRRSEVQNQGVDRADSF